MLKNLTLVTALVALASPAFAQDCSDPAVASTPACTGFDASQLSNLTGAQLYAAGFFAAAAAVGFFGSNGSSGATTTTIDSDS